MVTSVTSVFAGVTSWEDNPNNWDNSINNWDNSPKTSYMMSIAKEVCK